MGGCPKVWGGCPGHRWVGRRGRGRVGQKTSCPESPLVSAVVSQRSIWCGRPPPAGLPPTPTSPGPSLSGRGTEANAVRSWSPRPARVSLSPDSVGCAARSACRFLLGPRGSGPFREGTATVCRPSEWWGEWPRLRAGKRVDPNPVGSVVFNAAPLAPPSDEEEEEEGGRKSLGRSGERRRGEEEKGEEEKGKGEERGGKGEEEGRGGGRKGVRRGTGRRRGGGEEELFLGTVGTECSSSPGQPQDEHSAL